MDNVWRQFLVAGVLGLGFCFFSATSARADGCALDNVDPTCFYNGAYFLTDDQAPTGTGVIDSFLRVQMKGSEQGFNTDSRQSSTNPPGPSAGVCDTVDCDSKVDQASYTRDIQLKEVGKVTYNGAQYYEFLLDVNEQAAIPKNLISLDQLELYVSSSGTIDTSQITHNTQTMNTGSGSLTLTGGSTMTKVYDLDSGVGGLNGDNWINIDYNLSSSGSGNSDLAFLVPTSYFSGFSPDSYVYLYSEFGCVSKANQVGPLASGCTSSLPGAGYYNVDKYKSGAGFEEWWTLNPNGDVNTTGFGTAPEPGTFALIGTGLAWIVRRRRKGAAAKVR